MRWVLRILAAAAVLAAGMGNAQQQAPRLALVIGNAAYTTPGWQLVNPVNDATLIATRLRALGFSVTPLNNASKTQMEAAMASFVSRLRAGGEDAVGVFYYAGHAAEHDGANLLVPVDVTASSMDELRYQAPPLNFVLRDMARAGNKVNIVILDACRNLPLPSGTRAGAAGGLADFDDVPTNVLLAYATRAGATAPDNPGERNSVFTRTLAEALAANASDPLEVFFANVQSRVATATGFQQRPEFRSQLLRAPGFRLAAASQLAPGPDQAIVVENAELRRRIDALERAQPRPELRASPGTVTQQSPAVSTPVVVAPRPDTGNVARASGSVFRDCADCPEMVVIPGGSFSMGKPASERAYPSYTGWEEPRRTVTLQSFAVGKFEVTFDEWAACAKDGGCRTTAMPSDEGFGRARRPVINVSSNDAKEYVAWLSQKTRHTYRLMSEAEFEYAARAGTTSSFVWGVDENGGCRQSNGADMAAKRRDVTSTTSTCDDGYATTAPVGQFAANGFGLHDMIGNVSEWTDDCWNDSYNRAPVDGSVWTSGDCWFRVLRGGSYASDPSALRSAYRWRVSKSNWFPDVGFRAARVLY